MFFSTVVTYDAITKRIVSFFPSLCSLWKHTVTLTVAINKMCLMDLLSDIKRKQTLSGICHDIVAENTISLQNVHFSFFVFSRWENKQKNIAISKLHACQSSLKDVMCVQLFRTAGVWISVAYKRMHLCCSNEKAPRCVMTVHRCYNSRQNHV